MESYQSENPSNSEILINYNSDKKVEFNYPEKKNTFRVIFGSFLLLWGKVYLFVIVLLILIDSFLDVHFEEEIFNFMLIDGILSILIISIIFTTNKNFIILMPKLNKFISSFPFGSKKCISINKLDKKVFEVPLFDNVFLDYNATEEFSKYLYKVEIREHDFKYLQKSIFNKEGKLKKIHGLWKANFYFSKIPKTGKLEVCFF